MSVAAAPVSPHASTARVERAGPVAWTIGAGVAAAVLAPGSLVVAMALSAELEPRGTVMALWAAGLSAVALAVFLLVRRSGADRAGFVAASSVLGVLPTVFLGSIWSASQPIVRGGWDWCGTGDATLVLFGLPMTGVFAATGVTLALVLSRWRGALLERSVGGAALLSTAALGALLVALAPKLSRPAPDAWVESVPIVTALDFAGEDDALTRTSIHRLSEGVALRRECAPEEGWDAPRSRCALRLVRIAPGTAGAIGSELARDDEMVAVEPHASSVAPGQSLRVARDEAHDLWLVRTDEGLTLAFDGLVPAEVEPIHVADAIAPAEPSMLAGALGLLIALGLLLARGGVALRARAIRRAREGRVDGHGIAFDDGELPARGALVSELPVGPAVAWVSATAAASYRDDGTRGAWRARSGTRGALLARLGAQALALDALALAVAALTVTPLAVSARMLLLG